MRFKYYFVATTYEGEEEYYRFYTYERAKRCHEAFREFAGELGIRELGPVTAY